MMKAGDTIVLTEGVTVVDSLGVNYLPRGTQGEITEISGSLLTMRCRGEICQGIPLASARRKEDGEEAAAA